MDDSFETWKICRQIDLAFRVPFVESKSFVGKLNKEGPFMCYICESISVPKTKYQSCFIPQATTCSAGHTRWRDSETFRICADCSLDSVQRITERRQLCYSKNCGRYVVVDKPAILGKSLSGDTARRYLAIVDRFSQVACTVCFDDMNASEGTIRTATSRCQHDGQLCPDCLKYYVEDKIKNGNWQSIQCPHASCNEELNGRDVHSIVEEPVYKLYDDQITKANLAKNPNFRWCYTNCGNGQVLPHMPGLSAVGDKTGTKPTQTQLKLAQWRCNKCSKMNCFRCKNEIHVGETCEQAESLKPHRGDNDKERRRISKKCPKNGCGRYIGKTYGCVHMHCSKATGGCGVKFCWKCKVIFPKSDSHETYHSWTYQHLATCPMLGGHYETAGTIALPKGDAQYAEGWADDPDYEAGESGSEHWR